VKSEGYFGFEGNGRTSHAQKALAPLPMTETDSSSRSHFPSHSERRVWLISSGDSPIGVFLARQILAHGDCVVSGLIPSNLLRDESRRDQFEAFLEDVERYTEQGWKSRFRAVMLDIRWAISLISVTAICDSFARH
jgi:hypothetical protein